MRAPEVRYARTAAGVHIAYQVVGDGPRDLVFVPGYAANLQWQWELPSYARFLERLASFSRLIIVDRRGAGLSDRFSPDDLPPLEDLADDLEVVLDDAGSAQAALFGAEDGAMICCMFAARRPSRTSALIVYGLAPAGSAAGKTQPEKEAYWKELFDRVDRSWGTPEHARWDLELSNPSYVHDDALIEWLTVNARLAASPGAALAFLDLYIQTDVRGLLPAIATPTLVLHRTGDRLSPFENARVIADLIPDATLVGLDGDDHYWVVRESDDIVDEIEEFLTGTRPLAAPDRILATVLFTDIVDSTARAADMGDGRWKDVIEAHDGLARRIIDEHRGRYLKHTGDGLLATFDGPARAVRCAVAIRDAVRSVGIEVRAGVHTGEVELAGDDLRGIAVHIGARVMSLARPSEVLVSSTVKDLVAGSGLAFEDGGEHELKGVPDRWHLYRVVG
jgi:class 3 adenylate cyclase/alpha-beta hydrolase superfamily lysophospholipase